MTNRRGKMQPAALCGVTRPAGGVAWTHILSLAAVGQVDGFHGHSHLLEVRALQERREGERGRRGGETER